MSTETVVFFYVREKSAGRKFPWQKTEFAIGETMWCDRSVVAAGIPEYDYGKRNWTMSILRKKIKQELLPALAIENWEKTEFLCHKSIMEKNCFELLEEIFPMEYQKIPGKRGLARFTPEDILESLICEYCHYDALIVVDGTADQEAMEKTRGDAIAEPSRAVPDLQEFIRTHCEKVNYLAVVTSEEEQYEELLEEMQEEYGLTGILVPAMEQLKPSPKYQVLVVDAGLGGNHAWRYLPSGCCYIDLFSLPDRQRLMVQRRKDVRYLSFYRQIDKKLRQR